MSLIPHHTNDPICALCEEKLKICHPTLQQWFRKYVKPRFYNCHISWGFRDQKSQEQAFIEGKSKLKWPDSAHNKTPAEAIDLFRLNNQGQAEWPKEWFQAIAEDAKKVNAEVFWGGYFHTLSDADHFEIHHV